MHRVRLALLMMLLLLAALPGRAAAATIRVDDDAAPSAACGAATAPCPTLADAAAIVAAGDVVELASGSYVGDAFTRAVDVRATGPAKISGTLQFGAGGTISGLDLGGARVEAWNSSVVIRGSRLTGATLVTHDGTIDARRNWWGTNDGAAATSLSGAVDAAEPLTLAVTASGPVLVGGSALVTISLVDRTGAVEPLASGFAASASATGVGWLDASSYVLRAGSASGLLLGTSVGTATADVQLDAARASASVQVIESGPQATPPPPSRDATPGAAEAPRPLLSVSLGIVYRALQFTRTRGVIQIVRSNRATSVRSWLLVSDDESRRLGLRAADDPTHEWFIVGTVRTRMATGTRAIPLQLSARPAYAARRARHSIRAVIVTKVRDRAGEVRTFRRRIVLPARVR